MTDARYDARPGRSHGTWTTSARVDAALRELARRGSVTLAGAESAAFHRWERRRTTATLVLGIVGVLGVAAVVAGFLLRDVGTWGLLVVFGGFAAFLGLFSAALLLLLRPLYRRHVGPELEPVTLSAAGMTLRGIGPIPWADVFPPEMRRVTTRQPIGGILPVMPLTEAGRARAIASHRPLVVGPQPYLHFGIPFLRLPGIEGFSEEETLELFGRAHGTFLAR